LGIDFIILGRKRVSYESPARNYPLRSTPARRGETPLIGVSVVKEWVVDSPARRRRTVVAEVVEEVTVDSPARRRRTAVAGEVSGAIDSPRRRRTGGVEETLVIDSPRRRRTVVGETPKSTKKKLVVDSPRTVPKRNAARAVHERSRSTSENADVVEESGSVSDRLRQRRG
jgi:hypothetical protein